MGGPCLYFDRSEYMLSRTKDRDFLMTAGFSLNEYDYDLPPHFIAQHPTEDRSSSRLMVLNRESGQITHRFFRDFLDYIDPGDCLVFNNSKVFPARIRGLKSTGGKVEVLLLNFPKETRKGEACARALYRSSRPLKKGQKISCQGPLKIEVLQVYPSGQANIKLIFHGELFPVLESCGEVPLPPYIRRSQVPSDIERYQTIYAREIGSVAAPTAGLHFTKRQLELTKEKGIQMAWITLHVGYGTFAPVRVSDIREHKIHSEWLSVTEDAAKKIKLTHKAGHRVIAVGTTTVRALEATADGAGGIKTYRGLCDLYILPGHRFQVVDRMITNFHLPKSSLVILVSAFAGRDKILSAYREAMDSGYRFFSYGDAMFII